MSLPRKSASFANRLLAKRGVPLQIVLVSQKRLEAGDPWRVRIWKICGGSDYPRVTA